MERLMSTSTISIYSFVNLIAIQSTSQSGSMLCSYTANTLKVHATDPYLHKYSLKDLC